MTIVHSSPKAEIICGKQPCLDAFSPDCPLTVVNCIKHNSHPHRCRIFEKRTPYGKHKLTVNASCSESAWHPRAAQSNP